jgi:predicted phage terminase large subunit-like protein
VPASHIPAIAIEPVDYLIGKDETYHRPSGEALQPNRVSLEALEEIKGQVGSRIFEAQYQQNPTPADGNLIKREWIKWYEIAPKRGEGARVVQSWDIASTTTDTAAWSVCTTWLMIKRNYYLLDVWRGRLEFPDLKRKLIALAREHVPNRILIEQPGPGLNLIQELRANPVPGVPMPIGIKPEGDKRMRMEAQSARFEAGQVHLPDEAHWLAAFLHEILAFPNSRHYDQIDSVSQFLNWAETDHMRQPTVSLVGPKILYG